jgi:ankyrin repeat protein
LLFHESPISTHYQSGKGHTKIARLLSDERAVHNGQHRLHVAAQDSDIAALQLLLAEGENVDSKDDRGWTPLHTAAFGGHTLIVKTLLRHGAAVDAQDHSDRSSLAIAADEGHNDVVEELLRNGANVNLSGKNAWSPLNQALMRNHRDAVKLLLDAGANPVGQDEFGFAPLLIASKDLELVNLLLEAGADPNSDLVGGATVLHFAARQGNVPLVQRLLAIGMDVDLPESYTADGYTALYRAVEEQHEEAVRTLLDHGANPNKILKDSWTCILYAVKIGHYKILQMMVGRGADLRVTCQPEGWTALHIACREGHRLIVRLLLEAGSDVNARDASGATPLQLATAAGHSSIIEILGKAGGQ